MNININQLRSGKPMSQQFSNLASVKSEQALRQKTPILLDNRKKMHKQLSVVNFKKRANPPPQGQQQMQHASHYSSLSQSPTPTHMDFHMKQIFNNSKERSLDANMEAKTKNTVKNFNVDQVTHKKHSSMHVNPQMRPQQPVKKKPAEKSKQTTSKLKGSQIQTKQNCEHSKPGQTRANNKKSASNK